MRVKEVLVQEGDLFKGFCLPSFNTTFMTTSGSFRLLGGFLGGLSYGFLGGNRRRFWYEGFGLVVVQIRKVFFGIAIAGAAQANSRELTGFVQDDVIGTHAAGTVSAASDHAGPGTLEDGIARSVVKVGALLAMDLGVADASVAGVRQFAYGESWASLWTLFANDTPLVAAGIEQSVDFVSIKGGFMPEFGSTFLQFGGTLFVQGGSVDFVDAFLPEFVGQGFQWVVVGDLDDSQSHVCLLLFVNLKGGCFCLEAMDVVCWVFEEKLKGLYRTEGMKLNVLIAKL